MGGVVVLSQTVPATGSAATVEPKPDLRLSRA